MPARCAATSFLSVLILAGALRANYRPMAIEAVTTDPQGITVQSTGAIYEVTHDGIRMIRRIDPATNTVNPRPVAEIKFGRDLGKLRVVSRSSDTASVQSDAATFDFNADSLFFVTADSALSFTFTNLIQHAPWNKGRELDRMWTDGRGGSLHASVEGQPQVLDHGEDFTRVGMSAGDRMAFMAYPPRLFDFESLYGSKARPHVYFLRDKDIDQFMAGNAADAYIRAGFGALTLWQVYTSPGGDQSQPVLLEDGHMGYKMRDPEKIRRLVAFAHQKGFKIVPYLVFLRNPKWKYPRGAPKAGEYPEPSSVLEWMSRFRREYNFDGWYIDGAETGNFMADYNFMTSIRREIGPQGFIYYHNSIDPWGYNMGRQYRFMGLNAVFLDTYADDTLSGEMGDLATVTGPNDPYYRFYTGGYGISQSYASHKRKTFMDIAISETDNDRVIGENLNGTQRVNGPEGSSYWKTWEANFKPAYDLRRQEFLSGKFAPEVSWPIDPVTGWFRTPLKVEVKALAGTSVRIKWETQEPANSEVAYTSNGVWWPRSGADNEVRRSPNGAKLPAPKVESGPDGTITDQRKLTDHVITISDLNPETDYELKIRSSNGKTVPGEIVWQEVVRWKTGNGAFSSSSPIAAGARFAIQK